MKYIVVFIRIRTYGILHLIPWLMDSYVQVFCTIIFRSYLVMGLIYDSMYLPVSDWNTIL